jgi:hypothetical protein
MHSSYNRQIFQKVLYRVFSNYLCCVMVKSIKNNRQIISTLTTSVVVLTILLPLLVFPLKVMIYETKQELLKQLNPSSLELVNITLKSSAMGQVQFNDAKDEFSYQGSMYDLYSMKEKDGVIIIKAIKDESENALFACFKPNTPVNKNTHSNIVFFCFLTIWKNEFIDFNVSNSTRQIYNSMESGYCLTNQALQIFDPPPNG